MADLEQILGKLVAKEPILLDGTTIDDTRNLLVFLDPADKVICIDSILVDGRAVTTSLLIDLVLKASFGDIPLENYDTTVNTLKGADVIDGAPLYIREPLEIYGTNADDEDVAWNIRIIWHEVEDFPPTQLDSELL